MLFVWLPVFADSLYSGLLQYAWNIALTGLFFLELEREVGLVQAQLAVEHALAFSNANTVVISSSKAFVHIVKLVPGR